MPMNIPMAERRLTFLVFVRVVLLLAFVAATNHGVFERFEYLLGMQRYVGAAAYAAAWVTTLLSLAVVAFSPSPFGRLLWVVPLALSTLAADIYHDLTQLHFNIDTAEGFWQMRHWARDAVETFWQRMLWPTAKVAGLTLLLLVPPRVAMLSQRSLLLLPLLPILLCAGLLYRTGGYGVEGLPVQFSTIGLGGLLAAYPLPTVEREPVRLARTRTPAVSKILLVVDESVRADFIDLTNPAGVTPTLARNRASIVSYGIATSASNCSQAGNAILRMGANPRTLGRGDNSILRNPTIWRYAKATGYETTFLDAQAENGVLIDYMTPVEKALLDRFIQIEVRPAYQRDHEAAQRLRDILRLPTPQFVYLNKHGAHYPYDRDYPMEAGRFRPTAGVGMGTPDRPAVLNSYRNAVEWSTDGFFRILLDGLDLKDVLIVYTSDHGQNLLEDGDPVTHCRGTPSYREAMVPLLVITGHEDLRTRFMLAADRNQNRVSQFQVFPTLLELFGFDPEGIRRKYYLSLLDDVTERLGYTSGTVFGRFGVPPKWHPVPADVTCCPLESRGP
jgi:lipid A ethanolaminephosphotransferase